MLVGGVFVTSCGELSTEMIFKQKFSSNAFNTEKNN
jgi:hypothetical protein